MAIVPSFLIYVLWKTAFQVVYIGLQALACSILKVVDTVRTVKVLYSTSASVSLDVYIRILTDFPLCILYPLSDEFWAHADAHKQPACKLKSTPDTVRGNADKSLARPGRKHATANKLGIYSTYSPRSSIHFLSRCSNFCKPLKKNPEICPSNQVSAAVMTSASDEKWRPFNCFFSPGNRW